MKVFPTLWKQRLFRMLLVGIGAFFIHVQILSSSACATPLTLNVTISENQSVLMYPNSPLVQQYAGWTSQLNLLAARKAPYILLQAPDDPSVAATAQIASWSMTVGKTNSYNWDLSQIVAMSPGITATLNTPDGIQGGLSNDTISYNFTGFTKGKYVLLKTDIDPDPGVPVLFPDYRYILFNMNGDNLDITDNSKLTTTFSDPAGVATSVSYLPDFSMTELTWSVICPRPFTTDTVVPFPTTLTGDPVPEPSSFVLAGMGGLGVVIAAIRRRKQHALPV